MVAFDSVRPIYDFHMTWNLEEFKALDHTAQSLKDSLDQYTVWEKEVEKMRARQPCGILEVESRKLRCVLVHGAVGIALCITLVLIHLCLPCLTSIPRAMLLPIIAEKVEAVKTLIHEVARSKCKDQTTLYKARITRLTQRPMNLKVRRQSRSIVYNSQNGVMTYDNQRVVVSPPSLGLCRSCANLGGAPSG